MSELRPDPSYCLFAAEALLKQLQALTQEIDGVRKAEDIEYIHRMRVATRRLRSMLVAFGECFPAKQVAPWRKEIRRITRALGAARDTDVQIDFLEGFAAGVTETRYLPGIQRFLLRLRQRREQEQANVLRTLRVLEASGVIPVMEQELRQMLVRARLKKVPPTSPYLFRQASSRVALQLEEMLAFEFYVKRPECVRELHEMRIAAKRLRYTMQTFAGIYDDELKGPVNAVKTLQDLLGNIHDCDVWDEILLSFEEEERRRTLEYYGHARTFPRLAIGIEHLREERRHTRDDLYREFVATWQRYEKDQVWEQLQETLQAALASAEEAGAVVEHAG